MIRFKLNDEERAVDVDPDTPLLWVIRDEIGLTGTKFGCGEGLCGACTVHLDGEAVRSCQTQISEIEGQSVTTIEGIGSRAAKAVQEAWQDVQVPQCGYCQSGQIMQAAALLSDNPKPSDDEIDDAMRGNVCRCATYVRIREAIHQASDKLEA